MVEKKKILKMFGSNKFNDERIQQETNRVAAKLYPLMMLMTMGLMIFKLTYMEMTITTCILEIVAIIVSIGYYTVRSLTKGLPLWLSKDEHLRSMQISYISHSFFLVFFTILFGELILLLIEGTSSLNYVSFYFLLWLIPASILNFFVIKRGLLSFGSKKRTTKGLAQLRRNTVVGSLFFCVFVGWDFMFNEGVFKPLGIVWVLLIAALWGVPLYFVMKFMLATSEKQADKLLEESGEK